MALGHGRQRYPHLTCIHFVVAKHGKKLSKGNRLDVYVAISQKKILVAKVLTRKMARNRMNENSEN